MLDWNNLWIFGNVRSEGNPKKLLTKYSHKFDNCIDLRQQITIMTNTTNTREHAYPMN